MPKKLTTEEFIERAKKIHGDKYDYSKVRYNGIDKRVTIICPKHGKFNQTPHKHLFGRGCPYCADCIKKDTITFIENAKKIHGDKYDYSKVEYNGNKEKICIICPKHGEFWQTPNSHLMGHGCSKCKHEEQSENMKLTLEMFIERSNQIHHNKYDYSEVELNGLKNKITIICPKHGRFLQKAADHINGSGCPKCNCLHKTTEQFITEAKEIHGSKYDYSKVNYVNKLTPVCIICPEHGEFWQIPMNHLNGCNCPLCVKSKLECNVEKLLNNNKISFEFQKTFDWLGRQTLDFYLPEYNIAIECQGKQHFEPVDFGGKGCEWAKEQFDYNIKRDIVKNKLCKENNVKLVYYTDLKTQTTFLNEKLVKTEQDLLDKIIISEKEK